MVEKDRERLERESVIWWREIERESVIWWREIERDWRERVLYGGER